MSPWATLIIHFLLIYLPVVMCQRRASVQFALGDNIVSGYRVGNVFGNWPNGGGGYSSHGKGAHSAMFKPDYDFSIDVNGDITTKHALDRDVICRKLDCCEKAVCHMHSEAYFFTNTSPQPVVINVTFSFSDENDNSPKFLITHETNSDQFSSTLPAWLADQYRALPFLRLSVPEPPSCGFKMFLPLATDPDSLEFGINSYELRVLNGNRSVNNFRLVYERRPHYGTTDAETLTLITDQCLDREDQDIYWFLVTALGKGSPQLTGSLLVQLQIEDVNDNKPSFIRPPTASGYSIEVAEDAAVGHVVYTFLALDPDAGENGRLTYEINYAASTPRGVGLVSGKWSMNQMSGELSIAGSLDYENLDQRKFELVVVVKDAGAPSLTSTATVSIILLDVNDNPPSISIRSTGSMPEADSRFDLEENDNEKRLVKLISVSDPDSHVNDTIDCYLSRDFWVRDFTLTKYSSRVYGLITNRAFDYEVDADSEGLVKVGISCSDSGLPPLTAEAIAHIRLRDHNDNWPQFRQSSFVFSVYEDSPLMSPIGQVLANDKDSGSRGNLTYSLSSDDPGDLKLIKIDPKTGVLTTAGSLDRERKDTLQFHVTAADGGDDLNRGLDAKTNKTSLTIRLLDVNDNAPTYTGPLEVHMRENNERGRVILPNLSFEDHDLGDNGTFKLYLADYGFEAKGYERLNEMFSLVNDKQLIVTRSVDRERNSQFLVRIVAIDGGHVRQLTSTTTLTVIVLDENDCYPQLVHPANGSLLSAQDDRYYRSSSSSLHHYEDDVGTASQQIIPVDEPKGTLITTLRSRDLDAGENGRVSYRMSQARPHELWYSVPPIAENGLQKRKLLKDGSKYFQVDEHDGHLKTSWLHGAQMKEARAKPNSSQSVLISPPLDFYVIVVELSDGGKPPLTTRGLFYVNITEASSSNGGFFGVLGFGDAGLGNTVILILIIVCSIALVISLAAAIFWVRFRVDNNAPASNSLNAQVKYQLGCINPYAGGGTILRHSEPGVDMDSCYLDGVSGTFKNLEAIQWSNPNVIEPIHYTVRNASDVSVLRSTPSECLQSDDGHHIFPGIQESESAVMVRGFDPNCGVGGQYEFCCFPDTLPPHFARLHGGGSTESDSGLDSGGGGCIMNQISSPSLEATAVDYAGGGGVGGGGGGTSSEFSFPSTFKPSGSKGIPVAIGYNTTAVVECLRRSPTSTLRNTTTTTTITGETGMLHRYPDVLPLNSFRAHHQHSLPMPP